VDPLPGKKQLLCETDHSHTTQVQVINACSLTSSASYIYNVWCLSTGTTLPLLSENLQIHAQTVQILGLH